MVVGIGLALMAGCTYEAAPTRPTFTAIAAPAPAMTTLVGGAFETSPPAAPPDGAIDDVGLIAPAATSKEVARTELSKNHSGSMSGSAAGTSRHPVHLLAWVRCLGVGGPTKATVLISKMSFSVLGAPDQTQVLARRPVSCDGSRVTLDLGTALTGAAGISLVEPDGDGLRGYALLVRS